MPSGRTLLKAAGIAFGVGAAAAGTAYAAERAVVRRARRRPDADARAGFATPVPTLQIPSHDGGTIAIAERGEGPPIVLAHGLTLSMRAWVKQLDALPTAGFRAIAFDHRGHGASEAGDTGHSIENLAHDVQQVLETLDLHDAVLVGHSMGGIAMQAFVIQFPEIARERVRGLVLLSTLARTPLRPPRRLRRIGERLSDQAPDLTTFMRRRDLGFVLARVGFGRDPLASHVELTRQMIADCSPEAARLAPRALFAFDLTPGLPSIDLPTLVICGTADVLTPPAESRRIARLVPGARLELLDGGGHMLMLERAAQLAGLIVDFAREVTGSQPSVAAAARRAVGGPGASPTR